MIRAGLESSSVCKAVHTGIQVYIAQLLASIDSVCNDRDDCALHALYKWSRWKQRRYRLQLSNVQARWYLGSRLPAVRRLDIVHALDMRMPWVPGAKAVTTVYDLAVLHEAHQFDAYATERFRRNKHERYTRLLDRSDRVIAISENTKRDIVSMFDYPAERIHVIYPGLPEQFHRDPPVSAIDVVLDRHQLDRDAFLLFVGPLSERKNVHRLIDAYLQSGVADQYALVIAGNPEHTSPGVREKLEDPRVSRSVRCLGYVSDPDLQTLYAGARAFVFPTLYEGFGIPILEALASRTPVLAANRGAAPEVAGGFARLADPFDVESIAHGISQVVETTGADDAADWARSFRWRDAAGSHLSLYTELAGKA